MQAILSIPEWHFVIGYQVYSEVSKIHAQKEIIDNLLLSKRMELWQNDVQLKRITQLYNEYNLGDGETEAIAICAEAPFKLCCDDRKARNAAVLELGENSVLGSLRLLKLAVALDIITCSDAKLSYLEMRIKGGFLPADLEGTYFCKD